MADYDTRRFSRVEYDKMIELGVFRPGEAIELLGGHLVVAEPQGAAHYTAIVKTARAPEPDVAVVPGSVDDYGRTHPSRAALIVEVAETSLAIDRQYKGSLYARAGVADYWIVNLVDRVLEVYREPQADSAATFGWFYARNDVVRSGASVTPLATPASSVAVSQLLP